MESIVSGAIPARGHRRPSERVVEAVAAAEGLEPSDLRTPLYSAIDPDALDALFSNSSRGTDSVAFRYLGHSVHVDRDGLVRVESRGTADSSQ